MFHTGNPVEIAIDTSAGSLSVTGTLARVACPVLEVHLADPSLAQSILRGGLVVGVNISGAKGVYSTEATIHRFDGQTGQLVLVANGSFRYQQRRQHERYLCDIPVHLRIVGDSEWVSGRCRDISAGGARIYLPQEFTLRSNTLEIVFIAPDNQQAVRAIAEIVRTSKLLNESGWELGIRFTEMNRMEKIHFARLLQHWANQQATVPFNHHG